MYSYLPHQVKTLDFGTFRVLCVLLKECSDRDGEKEDACRDAESSAMSELRYCLKGLAETRMSRHNNSSACIELKRISVTQALRKLGAVTEMRTSCRVGDVKLSVHHH